MSAEVQITTGTDCTTELLAQAEYRGKMLTLRDCATLDCRHNVGVVHHYDDEGKHYCPTGFLMCCGPCQGVADEPEPPECTLWGERKPGEPWRAAAGGN